MTSQPETPLPPVAGPEISRSDVRRAVRPMRISGREAGRFDRFTDEDREILFNLVGEDDDLSETGVVPGQVRPFDPLDPSQQQISDEEWRKKVFTTAFREEKYSLDDLTPHRIRAAWRLVRFIAALKGQMRPDELLCDALGPSANGEDPWTSPKKLPVETLNQRSYDLARIATTLADAQQLPEPFYLRTGDQQEPAPGLPLLPPGVPAYFRTEQGRLSRDYEPRKDRLLSLYVQLLRQVASVLRIDEGSPKDPDSGRLGLIGLLDPYYVRVAFPGRVQLMAWEMHMVDETITLLVRNGTIHTQKLLRDYYALSAFEAACLTKIAKRVNESRNKIDIEEERTLMVQRIEEMVRRAGEALNLDAELRGLKQMAIVLGLSKSEPENAESDFINMVKRVAAERDARPRLIEQE